MSVTVPDCMWESPWRLRPTPLTDAAAASSISKKRVLTNSVPMSSEMHACPGRSTSRRRRRLQEGHGVPAA